MIGVGEIEDHRGTGGGEVPVYLPVRRQRHDHAPARGQGQEERADPRRIVAAKGQGCAPVSNGGGGMGGGEVTEGNTQGTPDVRGTWALTWEDDLEVEITIGGTSYTETLGAQGGIVTIDHGGEPFSFDLDCSRPAVVCPSEVWPQSVTFDQDFATVVRTCAGAGGHRVSSRVIEALGAAYAAGLAHSIEIRDRSGALVGGIFGLAIGKVFFTESHFALARDAAKVGFTALNCHLQRWGFLLNDGKHLTGRQCQLGYLPVTRESFNALLAVAWTNGGQEGRWAVDQSLNLAGWNPRAMSTLH